jgi:hypothetical protein
MARTPAQAILDEVVKAAIVPQLRPLGFKKAGRTFRRQAERCVQVLNVQASAWSSADELRFTINLGVFFPEVSELTGAQQPSAAGPTEPQCQLRERIGTLLPERNDRWWELRVGSDPGHVIAEVREAVRAFGLPWLDANMRMETAREKAWPRDAIAMCLAMNDRDEAHRRFALALEKGPHPEWLMIFGRAVGLAK